MLDRLTFQKLMEQFFFLVFQYKSQSNSKMSVCGSDDGGSDSFSASAESNEDTLDSFIDSAMGDDGRRDSFSASDELLAVFILEAVKQNDRNELLRVLKKCKENNFPRSGKITASCWEAIRLATSDQCRKKCLESLLKFDNGILISVDDQIALHIGCKNNREENILLLLQKGYEFHERPNGRSMLHIAAARGNLLTVSFLLNHSKNIDIKDSKNRTSLHYSAMTGCLEVSRILLESGADVNLADDFGSLPLHYACSRGYSGAIRLLLERDFTTINYQNFQGVTPFFCALNDTMDLSGINYLLEKGARTDIVTPRGMTAFEYGVSAERYDCLPLLLKSLHVSRIEKFCVYQISDRIDSLNTETNYPEDIKSLTCSAIDIGTDCLTVLMNRNLPKAISQAPSLIFYSGSFRIYSPLAFLCGIVFFEDGKFDQCLDLLLKHKITMLDEFQRKSQLQWPRSRIIFAHPFSNTIDYTVPLPKKLHYFNLLNANGVTTDYCLQCYHDNSMPFATFTNYYPYYDPVMNAVDDCDIETVKMLISTSAILEPDILNKCFVTNLPDTLDRASENFQEIRRMHEYLINLKPVYYEYDQHVDPYFTATKRFSRATLQQLCRTAIRQQLREPTLQDNLLNFRRKISELPLPNLLKDYLLFKI